MSPILSEVNDWCKIKDGEKMGSDTFVFDIYEADDGCHIKMKN